MGDTVYWGVCDTADCGWYSDKTTDQDEANDDLNNHEALHAAAGEEGGGHLENADSDDLGKDPDD